MKRKGIQVRQYSYTFKVTVNVPEGSFTPSRRDVQNSILAHNVQSPTGQVVSDARIIKVEWADPGYAGGAIDKVVQIADDSFDHDIDMCNDENGRCDSCIAVTRAREIQKQFFPIGQSDSSGYIDDSISIGNIEKKEPK